jgi:DNA-binding NarL/FixJ family response regulator
MQNQNIPDWYFRIELTDRQKEVLQLIAEGKTDEQIAVEFVISPKTVSRHRKDLREAFNAHSTVEMISKAISLGFVDTNAVFMHEFSMVE